jgi:hypothetical protein
LGENMRKSKKFWPVRSRIFRSLLVVAGVFLLMAALVPTANAQNVLVYFNFEDATGGGPPDFTSDVVGAPDFNPGGGLVLTTITTNATNYAAVDGLLLNRTAGDIDTANPGLAVGFRTTTVDNGSYIQFGLNAAAFSNMSLSFAYTTAGNGFNRVQLFYSTDGGLNFTAGLSAPMVTGGQPHLVTLPVPVGADHQANLVLRLVFNGGTSMGNNLETVIDNIQLTGVPEPATVAGGLLGVLGLCWYQRRRIRLILPRCGFRRLRRASV